MFKFDLKSGYHHVDVCQSHQQFLGFQWPLGGGVNRYFCFTVLPFEPSSAPYLFTKLFRPLVRLLEGLRYSFSFVFGRRSWLRERFFDN